MKIIINQLNESPGLNPVVQQAIQGAVMACKRCGTRMLRGTQCGRCGAWCR